MSMLRPARASSALILIAVLALPTIPVLATSDGATPRPNKGDFATVVRGAKLFQQFCSACHGQRADGPPPGWVALGNSTSRPPALNGSAHTWHHPTRDLVQTITFGTVARGGGMPPWGGALKERQIVDIISWLQSRWPKDKYQQWQKTDELSR